MSLEKLVLIRGNAVDYPKTHDDVLLEYTGWLFDATKADDSYKGRKFDSSAAQGQLFGYRHGMGVVISGWELALPQMSLGEKTLWTVPAKMAYGSDGYPGLIPPDTPLIFELELKGINHKRA